MWPPIHIFSNWPIRFLDLHLKIVLSIFNVSWSRSIFFFFGNVSLEWNIREYSSIFEYIRVKTRGRLLMIRSMLKSFIRNKNQSEREWKRIKNFKKNKLKYFLWIRESETVYFHWEILEWKGGAETYLSIYSNNKLPSISFSRRFESRNSDKCLKPGFFKDMGRGSGLLVGTKSFVTNLCSRIVIK